MDKNSNLVVNAFRIKQNDEIYKALTSKNKLISGLVGTVSLNHWMGLDNIQFVVEDVIK